MNAKNKEAVENAAAPETSEIAERSNHFSQVFRVFRFFRVFRVLSVMFVLMFAACREGELRPVDLQPEDMCAHCKMAISEKQFAAEFITNDGEAFKFDDIACMVNDVKAKANREAIAAFFVMDYETRQWLPGEAAHYVRSTEFKTPMSGGMVAFKDKAKADQYGGQPLTLDEILKQ